MKRYPQFNPPQFSPVESLFWAGAPEASQGDPAAQARQAIANGDRLTAQGKFGAALAQFHQAVWLCPNSTYYHYRLASAADAAGQYELVERHLHESVRLDPCFAPAHFSLGKKYRLVGKLDRAIYHSAITVALAPRNTLFIAEHGTVLVTTGQVEQAWELIESIVTAPGPVCPMIAKLYARIAPMIGHEARAFEVVERALQATDLTPARESKPRLQLAAAALLEKLGRYDEAFEYARAANELLRANTPYDPADLSDKVNQRINFFTPQRLDSLPRASHGNRRPVFIVGMPRSGTSLVEQILACHSAVFAAGELENLARLFPTPGIPGWSPEEPYPGVLESLSLRTANQLAARYLSVIDALNTDAKYVTDKMPLNTFCLESVELLLPGCRVIYCKRNPLDTCVSCYMTPFAADHDYKMDLAHIGACFRDSERMMNHWKKTLSLPILEIRYEDLVLDTESQVKRMLDFLELPWEGECMDFHRNKRAVKTASEDQVRKPIYTSSIGRWKHYEKHLGPLIAALASPRPAEA